MTSRNKIMYSFFVLFCISFGQVICIIHSRQFREYKGFSYLGRYSNRKKKITIAHPN